METLKSLILDQEHITAVKRVSHVTAHYGFMLSVGCEFTDNYFDSFALIYVIREKVNYLYICTI